MVVFLEPIKCTLCLLSGKKNFDLCPFWSGNASKCSILKWYSSPIIVFDTKFTGQAWLHTFTESRKIVKLRFFYGIQGIYRSLCSHVLEFHVSEIAEVVEDSTKTAHFCWNWPKTWRANSRWVRDLGLTLRWTVSDFIAGAVPDNFSCWFIAKRWDFWGFFSCFLSKYGPTQLFSGCMIQSTQPKLDPDKSGCCHTTLQ